MEKFGDPDFNYHRALVQIWGLMALHLSSDIVLPFNTVDYAVEIQGYVKDVSKYGFPLSFSKLESAASVLRQTAEDFEGSVTDLRQRVHDKIKSKGSLSGKLEKRVKKINDRLAKFERGLLDPQGIKGRTWFKHTVYAPGLWTGYSGQTFPSLAEAIDAADPSLIKETETRAAKYVNEAGRWLEGTYDEKRR
jgi:Transferrin receptor-like dimerisation domain